MKIKKNLGSSAQQASEFKSLSSGVALKEVASNRFDQSSGKDTAQKESSNAQFELDEDGTPIQIKGRIADVNYLIK